ncbi:MAG: flagellar assembly protein FliW [Lachnospiraceae bacterium]|nr:flagellar assembly protein FliW [Lachnospiraceae bacterium]
MGIQTKLFGEIEVNEEKKICFPGGIIGFPDLQNFLLIHDAEKENNSISWLQSVEEPAFAMPVIDPLVLISDYNPMVEDEMMGILGELSPENLLVLVTMTIPADITKMTANLKAPIVINAGNNKACQLIVEDEHYEVKHPIYDILKSKKEG